jgi:hypothetical protein
LTHQRGKRGKWSSLKWQIRKEKQQNTLFDPEASELVALEKFDYVVEIEETKWPFRVFKYLEPGERGLVLSDSKGRGMFQTVEITVNV